MTIIYELMVLLVIMIVATIQLCMILLYSYSHTIETLIDLTIVLYNTCIVIYYVDLHSLTLTGLECPSLLKGLEGHLELHELGGANTFYIVVRGTCAFEVW